MKSLWYMSFCDPRKPKGQQFLGALILEAHSFEEALIISHLTKLNPGGEIQYFEIYEEAREFCHPYMNRLMQRAEAESISDKFTATLS